MDIKTLHTPLHFPNFWPHFPIWFPICSWQPHTSEIRYVEVFRSKIPTIIPEGCRAVMKKANNFQQCKNSIKFAFEGFSGFLITNLVTKKSQMYGLHIDFPENFIIVLWLWNNFDFSFDFAKTVTIKIQSDKPLRIYLSQKFCQKNEILIRKLVLTVKKSLEQTTKGRLKI